MAEVFLKSGMSLACQFLFKHKVLKADWKLPVHGQHFVDDGVHHRVVRQDLVFTFRDLKFSIIFHQRKAQFHQRSIFNFLA